MLIKRLEEYPTLSYKLEESIITVLKPTEDGYPVSLSLDDSGFVVHYAGWHESFTSEREAIDCFLFGFSRKNRLKVLRRGTTEYNWTLQYKNDDDMWVDESTTGLIFYPFWLKEEIIYRQNCLRD